MRPYGRLDAALRAGRFAVTCEVTPPRGASLDGMRRKARRLRGHVDAVNVTDGQGGETRLASWAGCLGLLQEDVEAVLQLQCRDRNAAALTANLLGAGAAGIANVLLMTGDPPAAGRTGVFELDGVGLIALARRLRDEGLLASGEALSTRPRWLIGCVEDPFAPGSVDRLARKVSAGAEFVQTQYVFDVEAFERWLMEVRERGLLERCAVLAGVGPVLSRRALDYLTQELAGVRLPDVVRARLLGVPAAGMEAEGVDLCAETLARLHELPGLAGVHLLSNGHEALLPELLRRAGIESAREGDKAEGSAQAHDGNRAIGQASNLAERP